MKIFLRVLAMVLCVSISVDCRIAQAFESPVPPTERVISNAAIFREQTLFLAIVHMVGSYQSATKVHVTQTISAGIQTFRSYISSISILEAVQNLLRYVIAPISIGLLLIIGWACQSSSPSSPSKLDPVTITQPSSEKDQWQTLAIKTATIALDGAQTKGWFDDSKVFSLALRTELLMKLKKFLENPQVEISYETDNLMEVPPDRSVVVVNPKNAKGLLPEHLVGVMVHKLTHALDSNHELLIVADGLLNSLKGGRLDDRKVRERFKHMIALRVAIELQAYQVELSIARARAASEGLESDLPRYFRNQAAMYDVKRDANAIEVLLGTAQFVEKDSTLLGEKGRMRLATTTAGISTAFYKNLKAIFLLEQKENSDLLKIDFDTWLSRWIGLPQYATVQPQDGVYLRNQTGTQIRSILLPLFATVLAACASVGASAQTLGATEILGSSLQTLTTGRSLSLQVLTLSIALSATVVGMVAHAIPGIGDGMFPGISWMAQKNKKQVGNTPPIVSTGEQTPPSPKKSKWKKPVIAIALIALVVAVGSYFYSTSSDSSPNENHPSLGEVLPTPTTLENAELTNIVEWSEFFKAVAEGNAERARAALPAAIQGANFISTHGDSQWGSTIDPLFKTFAGVLARRNISTDRNIWLKDYIQIVERINQAMIPRGFMFVPNYTSREGFDLARLGPEKEMLVIRYTQPDGTEVTRRIPAYKGEIRSFVGSAKRAGVASGIYFGTSEHPAIFIDLFQLATEQKGFRMLIEDPSSPIAQAIAAELGPRVRDGFVQGAKRDGLLDNNGKLTPEFDDKLLQAVRKHEARHGVNATPTGFPEESNQEEAFTHLNDLKGEIGGFRLANMTFGALQEIKTARQVGFSRYSTTDPRFARLPLGMITAMFSLANQMNRKDLVERMANFDFEAFFDLRDMILALPNEMYQPMIAGAASKLAGSRPATGPIEVHVEVRVSRGTQLNSIAFPLMLALMGLPSLDGGMSMLLIGSLFIGGLAWFKAPSIHRSLTRVSQSA